MPTLLTDMRTMVRNELKDLSADALSARTVDRCESNWVTAQPAKVTVTHDTDTYQEPAASAKMDCAADTLAGLLAYKNLDTPLDLSRFTHLVTWARANVGTSDTLLQVALSPYYKCGQAEVVTLRPNAAGDETNIERQTPASDEHWDKVDDVVPDDAATYLHSQNLSVWERDLYGIPSGLADEHPISQVKVKIRAAGVSTYDHKAKICLKTHGVVYESAEIEIADNEVWTNYEETWVANPNTGAAWTKNEIDALQIGVNEYTASSGNSTKITQVYCEVTYPEQTPELISLPALITNVWNESTVEASLSNLYDVLSVGLQATEALSACIFHLDNIRAARWDYRWTDDELDQHINHAVREYSYHAPDEKTSPIATVDGSQEVDISSLGDIVKVMRVEYPLDNNPQTFPRFSQWGNTLTLESSEVPNGSNCKVYYGALRTLTALATTIPESDTLIIALGSAGYAMRAYASYSPSMAGAGSQTPAYYRTQAETLLARFYDILKKRGRMGKVRNASLYAPL